MAMHLSQVNGVVRAEDHGSMPRPVHGYGSVVAFEGNADLISTQLRLLPISSKILILNSLLDAIPRFAAGSKFDAPSFVAHVHKVFAARAATARSFLEDSTEEHPRLVLMNGGSMSAKAACLEKICEKVTSGDLVRAEEVYEDIVRSCGLDNMVPAFISAYPELILSRQTSTVAAATRHKRPAPLTIKTDEEYAQAARNFIQGKENVQETQEMPYQKDPGFAAMRAASLLDRTAASLHSRQNSEYKFTRTDTVTARTSIDTSVWGLSRAGTLRTVSDGPSDMSSLMSRGRTLVRGTLRDRRMGRKRFSSLDSNLLSVELEHGGIDAPVPSPALSLRHGQSTPLSPKSPQRWTRYSEATTVSSLKELNSLLRNGSSRDPKSIPPTPIIFEFGEARMVSYSSPKTPKRTSSVDGIFTIPEASTPTKLARRSVLKHSYSTMCLQDEPATFARPSRPPPPLPALPALPAIYQPRQVTVKASKRSLDTDAPFREPDNKKPGMVDRGCSPMRLDPTSIDNQRTSSVPSMPTSPTVEDLIIHVDDGHRNKILEAIMNGYRNNGNGVSPHPYSKIEPAAPSSTTVFNKSTSVARLPNLVPPTKSTITTDCRYSEHKPRPTIAHYAVRPPRKDSAGSQNSLSSKDYSRITANATPPTPASTPPPVPMTPTTQHIVRKLSDFGIVPPSPSALPVSDAKVTQLAMLENFGISPSALPVRDTKVNQLAMLENFGIVNNPIETQNSLRSTLAKHFPSKNGYNQYPIKNDFPDKLWKPVFQDSESTLVGSISRRTMDQILALGCDDFVEKGVWTNVLARVESLGMLKDGSAVGRLDMQYLMTTAMETFTTLPLSHQASHGTNPFTSPSQLAKLFVPHLERYLSSNPPVRFLIITFPSASLSSMIALRSLLGQDTMKVAMLSNPPSSTPTLQAVSSNSAIHKLSNEATIALNSRKRVPLSRLGNSKAQALLGNEQVPKPIGLKKSANGLMQLSRSSLDSEDIQERPDFTLEISGGQDAGVTERTIDDLVHKIRQVLIEKNSIYGSAVPPSPHFAIANWSAATAPGGRHSPTSSTSSRGSGGLRLGRKVTKQSIDDGVSPISPATFGRARGHELLESSLGRSDSRAQRCSPPQPESRPRDNRVERESGEWQKMYLSMGEDLEDFTLNRPISPRSSRPTPTPQPSHFVSQPRTKTPEAFNVRSDSRATNTSHLDSDSEEEDDAEDDEKLFLPRQGKGNTTGLRGGLPVRRDIGKALRMLGIA